MGFVIVADDSDDDGDDYTQAGLSGAQEAGPASQEPVNSADYTATGSSGEVYLLRTAMGKNKYLFIWPSEQFTNVQEVDLINFFSD
jgi:hypothetical protein